MVIVPVNLTFMVPVAVGLEMATLQGSVDGGGDAAA
jgi:hypothetical protein